MQSEAAVHRASSRWTGQGLIMANKKNSRKAQPLKILSRPAREDEEVYVPEVPEEEPDPTPQPQGRLAREYRQTYDSTKIYLGKYRHLYLIDADQKYKASVAEPLILEWQELAKRVEYLESRPRKTKRMLSEIEHCRTRQSHIENAVLRQTTRLIEISFHRSPLRRNRMVVMDDVVQDCQVKIVTDLFPAFDPTPPEPGMPPRKFYSLAYISLQRHMRQMAEQEYRYRSRNHFVQETEATSYESSQDVDSVTIVSGETPVLKQVWERDDRTRADSIHQHLRRVRNRLWVEFENNGTHQDIVDFFFRHLRQTDELPIKKLFDIRFGPLIDRAMLTRVYDRCLSEARLALLDWRSVNDSFVGSWD